MFIKEDQDEIIRMINAKLPSAYIVPLYVRNYNDSFLLEEMGNIDNFNQVGFHVGYGIKFSMFEKKPFPVELLEHFPCVTAFTRHSDELNTDVKYLVFEIGNPHEDDPKVISKYQELFDQIIYYFDMLKDYLVKQHEIIRKKRIQEMMDEYS